MITFKNLPDTSTPINAENLNNNFTECNNIMESGSNENGNYIKYSDGTLIQYGQITANVNIVTRSSASNWFFEDNKPVTLPVAFINTNYFVQVISRSNRATALSVYAIEPNSVSAFRYSLNTPYEYTETNYPFSWCATGRWK